MAEAIARRVFGRSHTATSAGAETGSGEPVAGNAIGAALEFGVDISNQTTVDVADLDLASYDLIVVFRPSSAEYIALPAGVRVAYLDVPDPYGSSPQMYKIAARQIERGVRRLYVEDAIRRASSGDVGPTSHLLGVFNRAAKECEKELARFVAGDLQRSVSPKATLGQLAESIVADLVAKPSLAALSAAVAKVNEVWVNVKHHDDPSAHDLLEGLTAIGHVFELLEQRTA